MAYPALRQLLQKIRSYPVKAKIIEPDDKGLLAARISCLSNYDAAVPGALSWLSASAMQSFRPETFRGALLICPLITVLKPSSSASYILTENPKLLFAKVANDFFSHLLDMRLPQAKDHAVSKEAVLANDVRIAKGVVIGPGVKLGKKVAVGPNTVLANCVIGEGTTIGANCSIGFPGFGYVKDTDGSYLPFPHIGSVQIGKNVRIGSNTCIDRGALGNTIIEDGVKIDNLVHIAHNVRIGKNSLIIANTMIGGSTVVGENVWVAPSASLLNKIDVEEGSTIGMGAVVLKNVKKNSVVVGNPGRVIRSKKSKER